MPEIDLTNERNRYAFLVWRMKKVKDHKGKAEGEGKLSTGEYVYAHSIDGESVNTFTTPGLREGMSGAFIRARVSDKHADELKDRGVVFEPGHSAVKTETSDLNTELPGTEIAVGEDSPLLKFFSNNFLDK